MTTVLEFIKLCPVNLFIRRLRSLTDVVYFLNLPEIVKLTRADEKRRG